MRAARRDRYGPPKTICVADVDMPEPADHEIFVRVHAASVSRTDCALLSARPFIMRFMTGIVRPRMKTLGTDFAGVVERVGTEVTNFRVGDHVWGMNDLGAGSHADYLVIPDKQSVAVMPAGRTFAEAAACLEGGWYAHSFMQRCGVGRGDRVLINGATGAIGSALLQLAVHAGATVTAVGNTKNLDLLSSLGAAKVIDYERADFTQDDETYDFILDAVGKSSFGACKHLLKPKGTYCSSEGGPGWQNPVLALVTPAFGRKRVVFPIPTDRAAFLVHMGRLLGDGDFRPIIDRRYALDEIQEAYAYTASGQKTGAVLLELVPDEQSAAASPSKDD